MGGKTDYELPEDARTYGPRDWLVYGLTGTPNTREKLVALTIEAMVKSGPSTFNAKDVCDRIDAKYGLVNYYFGNKEMLVAEASATTYKKHIFEVRDIINSAPKNPEKRLRSFIDMDIAWHRRMNSWAVLVSYPLISQASRDLIEVNFGNDLKEHFEFLVAMVARMVRDIRTNKVTEIDFEPGALPRHELAMHPAVVLDAISILYSAHGLNIWIAGTQIGSSKLGSPEISQKIAIEHHIKRMIDLAKRK